VWGAGCTDGLMDIYTTTPTHIISGREAPPKPAPPAVAAAAAAAQPPPRRRRGKKARRQKEEGGEEGEGGADGDALLVLGAVPPLLRPLGPTRLKRRVLEVRTAESRIVGGVMRR
jgi:hypothetical protein